MFPIWFQSLRCRLPGGGLTGGPPQGQCNRPWRNVYASLDFLTAAQTPSRGKAVAWALARPATSHFVVRTWPKLGAAVQGGEKRFPVRRQPFALGRMLARSAKTNSSDELPRFGCTRLAGVAEWSGPQQGRMRNHDSLDFQTRLVDVCLDSGARRLGGSMALARCPGRCRIEASFGRRGGPWGLARAGALVVIMLSRR